MDKLDQISTLAKRAREIRNNNYDGDIKAVQFKLGSALIDNSHPHQTEFYKMVIIWAMADLEPDNDAWFTAMIDGLCDDPNFDLPLPSTWTESKDNGWFLDHQAPA